MSSMCIGVVLKDYTYRDMLKLLFYCLYDQTSGVFLSVNYAIPRDSIWPASVVAIKKCHNIQILLDGCSQYNVSVHHALLHLEAVAIVVFAYVLHVMRVTTTYMGSAAIAETHALLVLQQLTIPVWVLNRLNVLTTKIIFHIGWNGNYEYWITNLTNIQPLGHSL